MTLRTFAIYSSTTGLFTGRHVMCFENEIARNTPEGCAVMVGRYDRLLHRVDVETGTVVAYAPPHDSPILVQQRAAKARRRIDALERAQLRPLRELQLDPANADARSRLAEIEREIAGLRVDLHRV